MLSICFTKDALARTICSVLICNILKNLVLNNITLKKTLLEFVPTPTNTTHTASKLVPQILQTNSPSL